MKREWNETRVLLVSPDNVLREAIEAEFDVHGAQTTCVAPDALALPGPWDILVTVTPPGVEDTHFPPSFSTLVENLAQSRSKRGGGRVIHVVFAHAMHCGKEKAAHHLRAVTFRSVIQSDARRLAPLGVTVNLIELALVEGVNDTTSGAPDLLKSMPLARAVTVHEVACAIDFIASPAASYMTGVCLPVTGGTGLGLFPEQLRP